MLLFVFFPLSHNALTNDERLTTALQDNNSPPVQTATERFKAV